MLDVSIDLNPYGDKSRAKNLARIRIANITNDCPNLRASVYMWRIQEPKSPYGEEIDEWGLITDYDRYQPVINLLQRVLDDHWNETGKAAFKELKPEYQKHIKRYWE